jgi:hypothetical protein
VVAAEAAVRNTLDGQINTGDRAKIHLTGDRPPSASQAERGTRLRGLTLKPQVMQAGPNQAMEIAQ